jgi:hypothetical protein
MLLEKNFNISKSNTSLKAFLDGVHEFKNNQQDMTAWAAALDLNMEHVDCEGTPVEFLQKLFSERSDKIRSDLGEFIRGTKDRVDMRIA